MNTSVTTAVNLKGHRDDPAYADVVYVSRALYRGGWQLDASPFASPYQPGPDGSREQVIAKYKAWLLAQPICWLDSSSCTGRLGCWCTPAPCHAQVLAELADSGAD